MKHMMIKYFLRSRNKRKEIDQKWRENYGRVNIAFTIKYLLDEIILSIQTATVQLETFFIWSMFLW